MRWECRERFPRHRLIRKPLVSDPGMHHGTCVTHMPWCMSGSLTCGGGENVPDIPGACTTCNFTFHNIPEMWGHHYYFRTFLNDQINGYLWNTTSIFDTGSHSWAVMTSVKFERDSNDLTGACAKIENSLTEKLTNGALMIPLDLSTSSV